MSVNGMRSIHCSILSESQRGFLCVSGFVFVVTGVITSQQRCDETIT